MILDFGAGSARRHHVAGGAFIWSSSFAAFQSGVFILPAPAEAYADTIDPTVILGPLTVTPNPGYAIADSLDPDVILGPIGVQFVTFAPTMDITFTPTKTVDEPRPQDKVWPYEKE